MNAIPSGYIIRPCHIATPDLSDRDIAQRVKSFWTCAACGHREQDTRPEELRARARSHARTHAMAE
jgi:hypothetical protein